MEKARKGSAVIAVLVVLVLLGGGFLAWKYLPKNNPGNTPAAPVYAPKGTLSGEFPKNLILDQNAAVTKSYSMGDQNTAEWDSPSSADALFKMYQSYFKASNGWLITKVSTSSKMFEGIYAVSSSSEANVVFASNGSSTHVVMSILKR